METIGDFLRNSREQRGISLEDVALQTRVSLSMLKALEANDFAQIPSKVFARGFVRSYARCLDLNEAEAFRKFQESVSDFYEKCPETAAYHESPIPIAGTQNGVKKVVGGAALVGAAALGILAFYESPRLAPVSAVKESTPQVAVLPENPTPVKHEMTLPTDQVEDIKASSLGKRLEATELFPQTSPIAATEAETVTDADLDLVIDAIEASWILAEIDDRLTKEVLLQPGERIRWSAESRIVLTLGNAGGVKVEFNGEVLKSLDQNGSVIRNLILTR
jgi:cytoskeleton protein RodZ